MSSLVLYLLSAIVCVSGVVNWSYFAKHHRALPQPNLRIIGGNETIPHEYPFQVGLLIDGYAFCGGSLISEHYVLTAAHCADAVFYKVEVILGAHNIKYSEPTQVHIEGKDLIIHELYNRTSFENDIALIRLETPAPFNEVIKPVILPSKSETHRDYTNLRSTSIGWGLTHDKTNPSILDMSSVLQAVNLTVTTLEPCLEFNDNEYNIVFITEKNICTSGYRAKGSCEGDSGSPLLYHGKQIGIVSIGPSQCEACYPSVYTHVGKFLDWIESHSDVKIEE